VEEGRKQAAVHGAGHHRRAERELLVDAPAAHKLSWFLCSSHRLELMAFEKK